MRISDWSADVCSSDLVMPVPLALAATWDTALVERVHRAAAIEATSDGVDWTFSPMLDIARDPRWGRVVEGAGEDPYLGSAMAVASIVRSEEHTSELQSLMRISYAVFCLKKKKIIKAKPITLLQQHART